jgi:DNA-binding MarR family transcriptional regulator
MLKENGLPDISVTYFDVLQFLWGNDGISITDLEEKVQLQKSTMTYLINCMETAKPWNGRTLLQTGRPTEYALPLTEKNWNKSWNQSSAGTIAN